MLKKNNYLKRILSILLVVSMMFSSVSFANFFENNMKLAFAPELEIDENFIDDGMFYIPHECLEVTENGETQKYIVKVKRKGLADTNEKVKLSMIDITGRYDRDYSIKVINKGLFIENVENKNVSKSIDEYMRDSDYEEYNNSDAIVDGLLTDEDIMSEEEIENFTVSDDERQGLIDDASIALDELNKSEDEVESVEESINDNFGSDDENVDFDVEKENTNEDKIETDIENVDENLDEKKSIDVNDNADVNEKENDNVDKDDISLENANADNIDKEVNVDIEIDKNNSVNIDDTKKMSKNEEEAEAEEITETESENEKYNVASKSTTVVEEEDEAEEKIEKTQKFDIRIASISDIEYSDEEVKFDIKKATMSITEGYEMATGLKDDRKNVKPNRSMNTFGVSPNSINDISYMREGVKAVEEGLKSAYVILDFKEGQSEKLIEVSIFNDNTYRGNRQVGFNLFDVDGSNVSGMYSSMTLIIHDDEEEVPTYLYFTKAVYEPENGYIEVEIERSGDASNVATCMLDSEDISAKVSRDYSQVHTQLVFGFGVNRRRIKIPIVSTHISKSASFKLKLQEAKGALLGEQNESVCIIKNTDTSFKFSYGNNLDRQTNNEESFGKGEDTDLFGAGGKDYDMDSILTGKEMDLQKKIYGVKKVRGNSNS